MDRCWQDRQLQSDAEGLVIAVLCRSLDTYCASLRLASDGYGTQAQMLNRSLFEDMVDAHWIATDPDTAMLRYAQHAEHSAMLWADVVRKRPEMWPDLEVPPIDQKRRDELNVIYKQHGTVPWSGLNIYERVKLIEHHWQDGRKYLRTFRDLSQRDNNETLHLSSASLRAVLDASAPDGEMSFVCGPREDRVDRALFGAFWPFAQTVGLVVDEYGLDLSPRQRTRVMKMAAFIDLTDEQIRSAGRNDPCPCESGIKFKYCHGDE